MWAFTRSPFVLMFAVLGPVIALATMGDSRRRARAEERKQLRDFDNEVLLARRHIDEAHALEREERERAATSSLALVCSAVRDSERWRSVVGEELLLRLGTGQVASTLELETTAPGSTSAKPQFGTLEQLREQAAVVDRAPILVDARWGIGVCGPPREGAAAATSIAVQLAAALSPREVELMVPFDAAGVFQWAKSLPHHTMTPKPVTAQRGNNSEHGEFAQLEFTPRSGGSPIVLCVAEGEQYLPRECRVVVAVGGSQASVVRHPENSLTESFFPDYISERQAVRFAGTLERAAAASFRSARGALPERISLRELAARVAKELCGDAASSDTPWSRGHLVASVAVGTAGTVALDLVAEGPHAIVGGTTGSGKSEVLVTWVLALASAYSPSEVNFLLIDFKGGAAFAPVRTLPHTVGVLTDLDAVAARRAILSLEAELRHRERVLAEAGVRSLGELPHAVQLPRLVIVVDEFAAMVSALGELHDLFADFAARGRSLGIHLILCTQRPAGSIRESILANCALRVSLRVNNAADSTAVLGVPDAAKISANTPGRAFLLRDGAAVDEVQWAVAEAEQVAELTEAQAATSAGSAPPIRRPWLDPLPELLERSAVPVEEPPGVVFGLIDVPEEQRQLPAVYDVENGGNLVVVGAHRSGKSTTLVTIADLAPAANVIPPEPEVAWDAVTRALASVRSGVSVGCLVLDDLDLVIGRFGAEHEAAFVERLMALAREGPRVGTTLVMAASSLRGRMSSLASLCAASLLLRVRDRQEHVLLGGDAASFCAKLPPGGGFWNGHRVQVCFSETPPPVPGERPPLLEFPQEGVLAVVSARPDTIRAHLQSIGTVVSLEAWRARASGPSELDVNQGCSQLILLGDPDSWASWPLALADVRSRATIVFHDCSIMEFRSITRLRELPPPVTSPQRTVIVLQPDGSIHRAALAK